MNYIRKETIVSSIINALFSIVFFVAAFHDAPELTLGGFSRLTMDFLPQSFFVGLFAALPTTLLTLKRLKAGTLSPSNAKMLLPLPRYLPVRILCLAFGSLLIFGVGVVLVLSVVVSINLGFTSALFMKALYGILITAAITPVAVRSVLNSA